MSREELWSQIRQGLRDGIHYTVQKTEELTKLGRLKLEIASQKRRIGRRVADLGARVYDLLSEDMDQIVREDEQVRLLVEQLKEDEARLMELEQDLETMRAKEAESLDIDASDLEDDLYKSTVSDVDPETEEEIVDAEVVEGDAPVDAEPETGKDSDEDDRKEAASPS